MSSSDRRAGEPVTFDKGITVHLMGIDGNGVVIAHAACLRARGDLGEDEA